MIKNMMHIITFCKNMFCKPQLLNSFGRNFATTSTNCQKKNELITLDPMEMATGMYKRDILDRLQSQDDPFSVKTIERGPGTKEQPNLIPSAFESRMVGCICEEDSPIIVWMWLHKEGIKKCKCGHYFQLYYEKPFIEESGIPV